MTSNDLITEIEEYAKARGISPPVVCIYAVNHYGLYNRLKGGGTATMKTVERLRKYFAENPPKAR